MSSPVETVDDLLHLGALLHDKLDDRDDPSDFSDFLKSKEYGQIKSNVEAIIDRLSEDKIEAAITAINAKREALRGDKSLGELPNDKMVKYLQLGDLRRALRTRSMQVASNEKFLRWVTEDLLPVLLRVGKTVIDILL